MPKALTLFTRMLQMLEAHCGHPQPPVTDPLGMILWENVAYLVDDERRAHAFQALKRRVGLKPKQILEAPDDVLFEVAKLGGMLPEQRVEKLRFIAALVLTEFGGDLHSVLKLPLPKAKKALKKFPGIGDPGAEKILLFAGVEPTLALESNGLRALLRLGFGQEQKNYAASYHSAQQAVQEQAPADCAILTRAHQLLRQHGQELCRRSEPLCEQCPVSSMCAYYKATRR